MLQCSRFVLSFDFLSVKARLAAIYGAEQGLVCGLVFVKVLVGCVKIIYTCPHFLIIILVPSCRCMFMDGSNLVSIVILELDATEAKESIFARDL